MASIGTHSNQLEPGGWRARALLSIPEVATITGLGRATIFRLIAAGSLASVRIGKRRCVRPEAVAALIELGEVERVSTGMGG
jgi:excisionase family DNA binding protein